MSDRCPSCGAEVQQRWRLCPECETPLGSASAPEESFSDRQRTAIGEPIGRAPADRGEVAGRYRILGELGRGGMGVVYRAEDTRLGRQVALKRLAASAEDDRLALERFEVEARSIAALSHPNILTVYDIGEDAEGHFIAMELVEGRALDELIRESGQGLDAELATGLFRGICAGLDYAHRKGVIHRDIKPSNVLVTSAGVPRIVDFGLARQGRTSGISMTGLGMGTLDYAAPEQKEDAKSVDHRADIYSLGCTFYEMLTGLRPPPHPGRLDGAARELILRATDPDPARRFFSVAEMRDALEVGGREARSHAAHLLTPPPRPYDRPSARIGWSRDELPSYFTAFGSQLVGRGFKHLGCENLRRRLYRYVLYFLVLVFFLVLVTDVEDLSRAVLGDRDILPVLAYVALAIHATGLVEALGCCFSLRQTRFAEGERADGSHPSGMSWGQVLRLQLCAKAFHRLHPGARRWALYFGAGAFCCLVGLVCLIAPDFVEHDISNEIFDEDETVFFLVLASGIVYLLGVLDALLVWRRLRARPKPS